jgi:hypothetical protein
VDSLWTRSPARAHGIPAASAPYISTDCTRRAGSMVTVAFCTPLLRYWRQALLRQPGRTWHACGSSMDGHIHDALAAARIETESTPSCSHPLPNAWTARLAMMTSTARSRSSSLPPGLAPQCLAMRLLGLPADGALAATGRLRQPWHTRAALHHLGSWRCSRHAGRQLCGRRSFLPGFPHHHIALSICAALLSTGLGAGFNSGSSSCVSVCSSYGQRSP